MKIVIDIPNSLYANLSKITNGSIASKRILDCVKNGTPLPKGHGRLIDISPYEQWFNPVIQYDDCDHIHQVYTKNVPTIIEADKGEEE